MFIRLGVLAVLLYLLAQVWAPAGSLLGLLIFFGIIGFGFRVMFRGFGRRSTLEDRVRRLEDRSR